MRGSRPRTPVCGRSVFRFSPRLPAYDTRRPRRRRHRDILARLTPTAAPHPTSCASGARAIASPAPRTVRPSPALFGIRCASSRPRPAHGWAGRPRAGAWCARRARGLDVSAVSALCTGERHAPAPLSDHERERLILSDVSDAPAHVQGDYPEWLAPQLAEAWGERAAEEGRALSQRAPVDLRANLLKSDREAALKELDHLGAKPTPRTRLGACASKWGPMAASRRFPLSRVCARLCRGAGRGVANRRAAHRRRRQPAGAGPCARAAAARRWRSLR